MNKMGGFLAHMSITVFGWMFLSILIGHKASTSEAIVTMTFIVIITFIFGIDRIVVAINEKK